MRMEVLATVAAALVTLGACTEIPVFANDECLEAACQPGQNCVVKDGWCFIQNRCYRASASKGSNLCLVCNPDQTKEAFVQKCGADGCAPDTGVCASACVPDCGGAVCGSDGCGGTCGACGVGQICDLGSCTSATGGGEDCESAATVVANSFNWGETLGAGDFLQHGSACPANGGTEEEVWAFSGASGSYLLRVVPEGDWDPVAMAASACDNDQLTCIAPIDSLDGGPGGVDGYIFDLVDGDRISVEGDPGPSNGVYSMTLSALEDCAADVVIDYEGPIAFDLSGAANSFNCLGGSDGAVVVVPEDDGAYTVTVTSSDPNFDVALYVGDRCPSSACTAQDNDNAPSGYGETWQGYMFAGTAYYIVADAYAGNEGAGTLSITYDEGF